MRATTDTKGGMQSTAGYQSVMFIKSCERKMTPPESILFCSVVPIIEGYIHASEEANEKGVSY